MKNEKIYDLLEKYRKELISADASSIIVPNGICYDGIVNEDLFEKSNKVLFLLKETNGEDKDRDSQEGYEDWNYRNWLEFQQHKNLEEPSYGKRNFYRTFYNVGMWSDLLNGNVELSFQEYMKSGGLAEENLRFQLGKVALVNLKKTWGGASTQWKALKNYLKNDSVRDVLRTQVSIIEPEIIICGSSEVYDFAKEIFGVNLQRTIDTSKKKIRVFEYQGIKFIEFYHPACRKGREFLYEFCQDVAKQIYF